MPLRLSARHVFKNWLSPKTVPRTPSLSQLCTPTAGCSSPPLECGLDSITWFTHGTQREWLPETSRGGPETSHSVLPALLDCSFLAHSPQPSHRVWAAQAHTETRHVSVPVNNLSWSPSQQPTSTASSRRKPSWVSSSHTVKGRQFQPILNSNHTGS